MLLNKSRGSWVLLFLLKCHKECCCCLCYSAIGVYTVISIESNISIWLAEDTLRHDNDVIQTGVCDPSCLTVSCIRTPPAARSQLRL